MPDEFTASYDVTEMSREQLESEVRWMRERFRKLWRKELRRRRFWGLDEQIIEFTADEPATLQPPAYDVFIKHWQQRRAWLIELLTEYFGEIY